jgi:hypothetical protein
MIILDTNVISEIMLPRPDIQVLSWLDRHPDTSIWTSSVNIFEIRYGLQSMPEGKKRSALLDLFERWLSEVVQGRIASFDEAAARRVDTRDTMIAGIVLASHAKLATRNVKHFEEIAPSLVNPWEA